MRLYWKRIIGVVWDANREITRTSVRWTFDAILTLENREECYQFFDDLCTVNELQSLSQRLQVAKMIKQGYTYATIEKNLVLLQRTISRVKRSLQWGNDAYTMILERLNIETKIILRLTYIYKLKCSLQNWQ